jgi:acyl carrier protein
LLSWTKLLSSSKRACGGGPGSQAREKEFGMDRSQLRQVVRKILEDHKGEYYEHLEDDVVLGEGLGLDSFDVLTLLNQLQNRFNLCLAAADLRKVERVGDLLDLLAAVATAERPAA